MKSKLIIIITCLLLTPIICISQYNQLGANIEGLQEFDRSGTSVSIDGTGGIVGIGALNANALAGQVRMLEWDGTSWIQKGSAINGNVAGANLGNYVRLNNSGNRLVAGAPGSSASPAIEGYAQVYEWDGTNWGQLGSDLIGDNANDSYGTAVTINSDGTIVAIAAEPFFSASYIRVFEWDGTNWNQLGTDILGTEAKDGFGRTIDLNADGTSLVVGVTNFDAATDKQGMMRVYEWDGTNWTQKGSDLIGDTELDFFGAGVTINDSGNIIAAGAREALNASTGYTKTFEWNGTDWQQQGANIVGTNAADIFGDVNDLNSDGSILICGTVLGQYARILEFDGNDWIELATVNGSGTQQFGVSISINNSGSKVAIGDYGFDAGGSTDVGMVSLFENTNILPVELIDFKGHLNKNIVTLNWSTAIEENNSGFDIQKSSDSKHWETIEFVKGQGNSALVNSYQSYDDSLHNGVNYYRLKQIDFDGQFEYSNIVAVAYRKTIAELAVFPNPSTGNININISNTEGQESYVQITDTQGRLIWQTSSKISAQTWNNNIHIESNGMYFITIKTGDEIRQEKLIIQR